MRALLLIVLASILVICGCPKEDANSGSPQQYDTTEGLLEDG